MATAALRSTTRRTADDAASSSGAPAHRRSRSLSRCPGRFPQARPADGGDELPDAPRGRFVNTVRGSGFPEISLDDLADEFFPARDFEEELERGRGGGRSGRRLSDAGFLMDTESSRRRGRSVSRKGGFECNVGVGGGLESGGRRRRSVSVARYRCSDSESESDLSCNSSTQNKLIISQKGNSVLSASHKPATSTQALRRSHSQKDLGQLQDSRSKFSSTLTDGETWNTCTNKSGFEKTIGIVYDEKKVSFQSCETHQDGDVCNAIHPVGDGQGDGFYESMRKEVRHAVDEIRTELERVIVKTKPAMQGDVNGFQRKGSEVVQAISEIRSYTTKLEESEKRKQELLAELAAEEQRGQELTKIVKELLPGVKQTVPERPSHFRRRSNDKAKMSKHLSEEAEKYFEDFISSVEDTDISSLDGERSDGSSTVGGITKSPAVTETRACLAKVVSLPAEIDGLVLPWLEWETRNDNTQSCKSKKLQAFTCSRSSRGSWSPGDNGSYSVISKNKASNNIEEAECHLNSDTKSTSRVCSFNMDEYMYLQDREDFLFEGLRQRQRIESGGLILCGRNFVSYQ